MKQQIEELLRQPGFAEGEAWRLVRFAPQDEIVRQGDTHKNLYWIRSGSVRVLGSVAMDEERQLRPGVCDLAAGEVFGELALFDEEPRSASVVAVDACELVEIDGNRLLDYLHAHPKQGYELLLAMMRIMVRRLRSSDHKIFSLLAWGMKAHHIDEYL